MSTVLKLEGLTKKYGSKTVVDHITFDIEQGEIFGLLGPNGAGKSTTLNMICSITKPTMGNILLFDHNVNKNIQKVKDKLGYVPQDLAIHDNLKAWENVELFTAMYGLKKDELKEAVEEALAFVGLTDKRGGFPKHFSGGMKRRLNIACAIGHKPELLIFDEPTVGIDPQSRNFILEKIKEVNKQGTTVIYTSHYMEEIEAICTRIAVMDEGKLIALGTKEDLVKMITDKPTDTISLEEVFLTMTGKKLRDFGEGGF